MKFAIASGKGGTGKTTVSANIFHRFGEAAGDPVVLVDCDVEEPNDALFFPEAGKSGEKAVNQEVPVIEPSKCTFCRKCVEYCEFNAILVIPPVKFAEVNANLCHSCGACTVACNQDAIWVREVPVGTLTRYDTGDGNSILEGRLKIGSAMQTMVIRELKKNLPSGNALFLFDAPPGTSCPVVETLSDADYVILVTEPTPFGLHDLKLMVGLVRELGLPFGVVINKANLGNRDVYSYLGDEGIEILAEIPYNREYAARYASGDLFTEIPDEILSSYEHLFLKLEEIKVKG